MLLNSNAPLNMFYIPPYHISEKKPQILFNINNLKEFIDFNR